MPTIRHLDRLVAMVREGGEDLFVRWSRGPAADVPKGSSRDELTGVPMPGLSANPLKVEAWWGQRSTRLWVARRLYDYRHLATSRGAGVRPWVMRGSITGRGPDNEPLVACHQAVAWIGQEALEEADRLVEREDSGAWGPLSRDGPQG